MLEQLQFSIADLGLQVIFNYSKHSSISLLKHCIYEKLTSRGWLIALLIFLTATSITILFLCSLTGFVVALVHLKPNFYTK